MLLQEKPDFIALPHSPTKEILSGEAFRADIEGLRAIAIIAVILYHFGLGLSGGYVGVDIFFVISGYLIAKIFNDRPLRSIGDLFEFLWRRLRRLLPAMLVMTATTIFLAIFLLMPSELHALGESAWRALFFSSNYLFLSQAGYFDAPSLSKPLLHTWSLALEGQFYLVFAVLLGLLFRLTSGKSRTTAAILVAILLLSLVCSAIQVRVEPQKAFFTLPTRLWEFVFGALLVLRVIPNVKHTATRNFLQVLGFAMIVYAAAIFDHNTRFPGENALLPVLGATLIIYSRGTDNPPIVSAVLQTFPIRWIGRISYSLYLWHWPLLALAVVAMGRLDPVHTMALSAVVLGLSILSYRFVERPYHNWKHSPVVKYLLLTVLFASLVAIITSAMWIVRVDGWPGRLSAQGLQFASAVQDVAPRDADCHTVSPERVRIDELCKLGMSSTTGDRHKPVFVVWGDSHAHALIGAFDSLAVEYALHGSHGSRGACPPLLDVNVTTHTNDDCSRFNQNMVAYINRHDVKYVFLVARWAVYTSGHTPGSMESGPEPLIELVNSPAGIGMSETFSYALDNTLAAIRRPGRTIYLVSSVPESTHHIPFSLARSTLALGPSLQVLQPRRSDFDIRQKIVQDAFERLQIRHDIKVLRIHERLCDQTLCQIVEQGRSLYRDADHLSSYGASIVQPVFKPIFQSWERYN